MKIFRGRLPDGKVAFLTGGGSGITLRIAGRFAAHGARVALPGLASGRAFAAGMGR